MADLNPVNFSHLAELLDDWKQSWDQLGIIALVPESEARHIPSLQALCRAKGVALAGAIFPALVVGEQFRSEGMLLLRTPTPLPSCLVSDLPQDSCEASAKILAAVETLIPYREGLPAPTLFMVFDSLVPNIASILDNLYLVLADRVAYAGVNAGSERFCPLPCLFDAEQLVGTGVLCLQLPPEMQTVLEHHYHPPELLMSATGTEGNRILQIDWQPAFHVYRDFILRDYGIALTPENFYQYAVHFPFGILRANSEVVVRIPVALESDGSLFCIGEVPENSILTLLEAPKEIGTGCTRKIVEKLSEPNTNLKGGQLLSFYCAGRRMHFGSSASLELKQLLDMSGVAQLAGALSLGEIGSTKASGYPLFHNAALVCTTWGIK